jgi:signal transduction histidine kinase
VSIVVRDSARGIPASELPHIFDAFWQGTASEATRGEGAGLGLALVRRLAHALGGDVSVESKEGSGSAFQVRLPSLAAKTTKGHRRRDDVPSTDGPSAEA